MTQVAIIVEYAVNSGGVEQLQGLLQEHARKSLELEGGCIRFEVIKPTNRLGETIPGALIVNELYRDFDAVSAHENSDRMPILLEKIAPFVKDSRLIYAVVTE